MNFKGIIDSTLREGLQFSRASFRLEEHLEIFSYLMAIGVDYIEVSNPVKEEVAEMVRKLVNLKGIPRRRFCLILEIIGRI